VQAGSGCRPPLKTLQALRPVSIEAKGVQQLFTDGFYHLANASQPTAPWARPRARTLGPLRRANDGRPVVVAPVEMALPTAEAVVGHIIAYGWHADLGQASMLDGTGGQKCAA
jgi:hypothetical protein